MTESRQRPFLQARHDDGPPTAMSKTERPTDAEHESTYREYILGVRIVEIDPPNEEPRYRFETSEHRGREFADPETATLYADIYFCTNGFEEEGTGDRGVPPEIIGAGRAVMASYFLTQPDTDEQWVASFFGMKPHRIRQYVSVVRENAEEIRRGARERGME